jgi:hypothetical protein
MKRNLLSIAGVAALLALSTAPAAAARDAAAGHQRLALAVTATNEASNQIKVYDASTLTLVQTLSTNGAGGVGGNARGVRQWNGELFAVVNNGSNSVAIFRRTGDRLKFDRLVTTSSAPVSIDFGNGHMYVAGATTVDSFLLRNHSVGPRDGTASLRLVGGATPPAGSTAQVGAVDDSTLLVTLKTDPVPGTVDVVPLHDGAITGAAPTTVSAPTGTLTPFGFAVYPDGTAVMTLAHSSQDGLFRNGAFSGVVTSSEAAPCWMTRSGKYLFTANTGGKTISRLIGTGSNVFVDAAVAAKIPTGGAPSDIDEDGGVLGVIDHVSGASNLTVFTMNDFGELANAGSVNLGTANANGIAIMFPLVDD